MKVIIAGSRTLRSYAVIFKVLNKLHYLHNFSKIVNVKITEIVCGMAPGVDLIGKAWADHNKIQVKKFPADWENLNAPGARIKEGKDGRLYNANAGKDRNIEMAEYADGLIAFWDGKSSGTAHMIKEANKRKLYVQIYEYKI